MAGSFCRSVSKALRREGIFVASAALCMVMPAQKARAQSAASDPSCFPPCRSAYVCSRSQCVSLCNPACPSGQKCTAAGQCVARALEPPSAVPASISWSVAAPAPAVSFLTPTSPPIAQREAALTPEPTPTPLGPTPEPILTPAASPNAAPKLSNPSAAGQVVADSSTEGPSKAQEFSPADAERARFSGGRYVVELLASGAGGSLAAYGTIAAICGSGACDADVGRAIGGFLAALGANVVTTPLIVAGTGALMGGRGSVGSAFWGAVTGMAVGGLLTTASPVLGLAVGVTLMPIVSPLFYERDSNERAKGMKQQLKSAAIVPSVAPIVQRNGVTGVTCGLNANF
jgi:hypothetical protein